MAWATVARCPPTGNEEGQPMPAKRDVDLIVDAIRKSRETWQPPTWPPPAAPGYRHTATILVDTIFNLGAKYVVTDEGIFVPVDRYARFMADKTTVAYRDVVAARDERAASLTLQQHVDILRSLTSAERIDIFDNRRPSHTRAGSPRRADVVVSAAEALMGFGQLDSAVDVARVLGGPEHDAFRKVWFSIPGLSDR
jgi:hypothetical protein